MNLQSKQDVICHVAKVKVATSTHSMADVTHFYSLRIQSFYKTNTKIYFAHNKENRENICNIVRVFMFQQRLEKPGRGESKALDRHTNKKLLRAYNRAFKKNNEAG